MTGLHWIDGVIVAAYACSMIALGWYYNRKQQSTDEYFTGGGAMNPFLIGISLFSTLLSTITYLSSPGEIAKNGPVILAGALAIPVAYVVVGHFVIPIFMRYRLTSAYELLEQKLGLSSRLIGAAMFTLLRLAWMATLLNFAANAMLVMLGWESSWLLPITIAIGTVALIYSSLGGLRAVVITDLAQFVLLFGGALLVVATVTYRMDGIEWFPDSWDASWKSQPVFSFDPQVRMTVVGVIIMQVVWFICTAGGDQTAIQRFMATRDASSARRSYLVNMLASLSVITLLALVGLCLKGYYESYPQFLPPGESVASAADKLFPHFIATGFPVGISGLVVSGMFAAAMSSIDSGVNSISAVVMTDYVERFRDHPLTNVRRIRTAQAIAVSVGVCVIFGSLLIEHIPGNLLVVSKRVTDLLVTPIFTLFFTALFVPKSTAAGANAGALSGFATAILVAFWNPLIDDRSLSVTWINPTSLTVGITVGCLASWLSRLATKTDRS